MSKNLRNHIISLTSTQQAQIVQMKAILKYTRNFDIQTRSWQKCGLLSHAISLLFPGRPDLQKPNCTFHVNYFVFSRDVVLFWTWQNGKVLQSWTRGNSAKTSYLN